METIVIVLLCAGAAGGFVKSLIEQHGSVVLPTVEEAQGTKYVHLGFIGNVILGAVIAVYTASDPASAFTAGLTAVFIAEKLIERAPAIIKK